MPYTGDAAGFTIECANGQHCSGRAAESSAFNPSVSAVTGALNQLNLSSHRDAAILTGTLASCSRDPHAQRAQAATLLRGRCQTAIQSVPLQPG